MTASSQDAVLSRGKVSSSLIHPDPVAFVFIAQAAQHIHKWRGTLNLSGKQITGKVKKKRKRKWQRTLPETVKTLKTVNWVSFSSYSVAKDGRKSNHKEGRGEKKKKKDDGNRENSLLSQLQHITAFKCCEKAACKHFWVFVWLSIKATSLGFKAGEANNWNGAGDQILRIEA